MEFVWAVTVLVLSIGVCECSDFVSMRTKFVITCWNLFLQEKRMKAVSVTLVFVHFLLSTCTESEGMSVINAIHQNIRLACKPHKFLFSKLTDLALNTCTVWAVISLGHSVEALDLTIMIIVIIFSLKYMLQSVIHNLSSFKTVLIPQWHYTPS